jgi:hypothetical protein
MSYQPEGYQPEGYQPEGYQPEAAADSGYPTVPASRSIDLPGGGVWVVDPDVTSFCQIDWSAALPTGVTLVTVAYTIPAGLVLVDEAIDTDLGKSAIKLSGMTHGSMFQVPAVATLSNAQTLPCTAPLRCFNG